MENTTNPVPTIVQQARNAGGFYMAEGDKLSAQFLAFFSRRIMLRLPLAPADFGKGCDLIDMAEAVSALEGVVAA